MKKGDIHKKTFSGIDEFGKDKFYQWKYLAFELKNAPAEFQKVMDRLLLGLPFVEFYIGDILFFSKI